MNLSASSREVLNCSRGDLSSYLQRYLDWLSFPGPAAITQSPSAHSKLEL